MCVIDYQEDEKSRDSEIYQSRNDFTIKYSSIRKFFYIFEFQSFEYWAENQRSDKIIDQAFDQFTSLGSDQQSYGDTNHIILTKETKKILEHDTDEEVKKNKL